MSLRQSNPDRGFTLVELLAVIATIAILASLLLPVLGKAKVKAQRTNCQSNLHQLGLAWELYHNDNNGRLVESYPVNNKNAWVLGDMRSPADAENLDLIRMGKLFPYNRNTSLYHCPTDKGVQVGGRRLATVRSYAMNSFMGARDPALGPIPRSSDAYVTFFSKDSEIRRPGEMWVLLDEDERSINDGFFVTDPTANVWVDFPAISEHRHNYSFAINFADGHSEVWRHRDSRTRSLRSNQTQQSGNLDLQRLAGATAIKKVD
jgi:prepilin-type N-terminal cleavage/methylation domain-containing protein